MSEDNIYSEKIEQIKPFQFNKNVVDVFNDMIHRSVPLYSEMIKRQAMLISEFYHEGTEIFDLGCSNGNLGLEFLALMGRKPFHMTCVDNSEEMIRTFSNRLENRPMGENIRLVHGNLEDLPMENASVVIINLTLQFLPLEIRDSLIKKVYQKLTPGGILLITEKTIHEDSALSDLQQDFYYRLKKENGYSNLEISQKRDALENVLIPETVEDHMRRFKSAGFLNTDIWLKWFNFASFICKK